MLSKFLKIKESLAGSDYKKFRTAVDRFLFILSTLYKLEGNNFKKINQKRRGKLIVISDSRAEIERSAMSPNVRRIPGTEYWAATKTSTEQKKRILSEALVSFGYDPAQIEMIINHLDQSS
jgi:negative modulator of initiation of replication